MAAQNSATPGQVSLFGRGPFPRPGLTFSGRRAQPRSRMAAGHREAARNVLDGGEHGGNLAERRANFAILGISRTVVDHGRLARRLGQDVCLMPGAVVGEGYRAGMSRSLLKLADRASLILDVRLRRFGVQELV
jgi:hypothetical protein